MPYPNSNETHEQFMHRCMSDPESMHSFPNESQRYEVCSSKWDKRNEKGLQKKAINLRALDVDNHKKQVKIAISELETVDRDNDIFDPKAYDKTIKENGPAGSNEIWHLLDHTSKSFSALGKFSELRRENQYIVGVSTYKDSFAWREVAWPLYEAGDITQHSVGFETLNQIEPKSENAPRIITEVRLYEGSAVLWGANPNTPTLEIVKRLMDSDDDRDITAAEKIDEIIKKMKGFKRGFNDEDYSLLIIELKFLQKLFDSKKVGEIFRGPVTSQATPDATKDKQSQVKATEPNEPTLPETVECPNCKKVTRNAKDGKLYVKCHRCNTNFEPRSKMIIDIF